MTKVALAIYNHFNTTLIIELSTNIIMIYRNKVQTRQIFCIITLRKEGTHKFVEDIIYGFV